MLKTLTSTKLGCSIKCMLGQRGLESLTNIHLVFPTMTRMGLKALRSELLELGSIMALR